MDSQLMTPNGINMVLSEFLDRYRKTLRRLFTERTDIDKLSLNRGIPPYMLRQIMDCNPLSVFIPEEYGGRGAHVYEGLSMLETTSYESLPLSLMMGINGALFLQPVANYGQDIVKQPIFDRFLKKKNLGGLMITEPDYGSDALRMQTSFVETEKGYHIEGLKHWAGLTGWADFWLITARSKDEEGELGRDISFFIHDTNNGGIEVEEYYKNLGLYMLPYGRNRIDIDVPAENRLEPRSTGVKMMLDILHRSRLQFPGMGMGFLRRMLDEAVDHCKNRFVGGKSLFKYDQVKDRLARLQSSFTACSAMCAFTSENAGMDKDVSKFDVSANAIKTVTTDLMHDAAQSLVQLFGAKGYRLDSIAGRSLVDSRPFQIFEGSNDILYQQISESILKKMRRFKERNLYKFLSEYKLTEHAADYFKDVLSFEVDVKMAQRKLVDLGKIIGRMISLEFTIKLGEKGFNSDLIANSIKVMRSDITELMCSFKGGKEASVIEDYRDNSSWVDYLSLQAK